MNPLPIRLARAADAQRIAELSRDLIEHGLGWRWTPQRVRLSIADAQTNVAVMDGAGGAVAAFGIMRYRDADAHLLLLAVVPSLLRRGCGSALVHWLEKAARVAGVRQVSLEARCDNAAALAFYRRLGYRELAMLPGYYQGVEDSVRLAKDLWQQRPALMG